MQTGLTRTQQKIFEYLLEQARAGAHAPTLQELCDALGVKSRGSMHKHIRALQEAGIVENLVGARGVRLSESATQDVNSLPLLGYIAAGRPLEALEQTDSIDIANLFTTQRDNFLLQVRGDSMMDDGILDGDWVVIEPRNHARNGEVVVALVDGTDATLKRIEQRRDRVILHPANRAMKAMEFEIDKIQIQGVVVGLLRRY